MRYNYFSKFNNIYIRLPYNKALIVYKNLTQLGVNNVYMVPDKYEYDEIGLKIKEKYNIIPYSIFINVKNSLIISTSSQSLKNEFPQLQLSDNVFISEIKLKSMYDEGLSFQIDNYGIHCFLHIQHNCNFGCKGCTHFAPLISKEDGVIPLEETLHDLDLLKNIVGDRVHGLHLLGGEPLLNENICDIVKYSRQLFPDIPIEILTNGFKLPKMSDEFYDICRDNKITIAISKYTVNFDYDKILKFLTEKGIDNKSVYENVSFNLGLDKIPNKDKKLNFDKCYSFPYFIIRDGYISNCFSAQYIKYFNKYFGENLADNDCGELKIDNLNYYDLFDFITEPNELCAYCLGNTRSTEWRHTKRDIKEWVSDDFEEE